MLGKFVNMECFVLKHSGEVCGVRRKVFFNFLTEARIQRRFQIRFILSQAIHDVAVGDVEQVAQAAAPAVPPLVADAVLQDHVVRAKGAQDAEHLARSPLGIDLVDLLGSLSQILILIVGMVG